MKSWARQGSCVILTFILVFSVVSSVSLVVYGQTDTRIVAKRQVAINVKLVFVGIEPSWVLQDYLLWNSPESRYQLIGIPGISTDTIYSVKYDIAFASSSFLQQFSSYLGSVSKTEQRRNVLWNETYATAEDGYYLNYTHFKVNATETYYAADDVELWLQSHAKDFGGLASNGYTLIVADLSKQLPSVTPIQFESIRTKNPLPLTPHFYNKTYVDHDLGIKLNRRHMTAWGGHSRFFFIDLSAGPGQAAEQLPLQLAAWTNRLTTSSKYWPAWLTQYLADYIWGAVYNLFLPDFVYPLNYAQDYRVKIFVFDNRSSRTPSIESTVDVKQIKAQLGWLLPFAKVQVDVKYFSLPDQTELSKAIGAATSPSLLGLVPVVDARPLYNWLSESGRGRISDFTETIRNSQTYDIPVLVFAFDGDYTFGFTYKELIGDVNFDRTIWGVSLYDMVLISHSATDLRRGDFTVPKQPGLGFGFTNTIIHEVGHMLGLMHPFHTSYDPTENFVSSVMAYYPYEDSFSQFDKDALLRGYADQLIKDATQLLDSTAFDVINWQDINSAKSKIRSAEDAYSIMNYTEASLDASEAFLSASRANILAGGGRLSSLAFMVALGFFSFLAGLLVAIIATRQRRSVRFGQMCSVCGGKLTWINDYQRWYCYRCKRYE